MDEALLSGSEEATRDCVNLVTDSRDGEERERTLRSFGMSDFSVTWMLDIVLSRWANAR